LRSFRKRPSAIGLRQVLPVQINKIDFMEEDPNACDKIVC
jgi:hypothetical protein